MGEVKPALTTEEWAAGEARGLQFAEAGEGMLVLVHNELGCEADITLLHDERHAAAAAALNGQPFGFTREMVDALRWTADNWTRVPFGMGGFGSLGQPDPRTSLLDIADRIEALLPPSDATTDRGSAA